jgi:hypothetical protein
LNIINKWIVENETNAQIYRENELSSILEGEKEGVFGTRKCPICRRRH